ncbi:hypothetical protein RIF29_27737 [Crotalaria pallida]|uniref:RNase P subunit p30 n=1 Tax=Crotalaria pallida TaxID=3830 RepID=A0AAN9I0Q7_CROPI
MGFFDLNIPFPEPTPATKSSIESTRTKIAVKAMELGYTGIAYNRTITGVMSDHHRCSIVPLTVSSLFKVLPALSLSAKLHRDALGVPLSTPFRQYTRLTAVVETNVQSHTLNSGNPILKTYDLVAVKPMNQFTFELACEKMEVDIISLDLSVKLPFRMKQPMVKAAIKRGVYFEITYSSLITDIQSRAQLISSFKLLMDFTRGKNIVFSSAAPSVNEFRGPYDAANLLSLLGFSKERAKEAISKNCRTLLTNSLRKKRFYKEAIKIDILSSDVASHSKEGWYQELLKWDPISSGEGDILLDDLTKSLSTSCETPKTAKAIDFDSVPSHGFQVKDFLPASNAFPVIPYNETNSVPVAGKVNQSTNELNNSTELPNRLDVCPEPDESSLSDAIATHLVVRGANFHEKNIRSGTNEASDLKGEIYTPTNGTKSELRNFIDADVNCAVFAAKAHRSKSDLGFSSIALDTVVSHENKKLHISPEDSNIDHKVGTGSEQVSPVQSASGRRRGKRKKSSDAYSNADEMKIGDSTFAKHLLPDVMLEDEKLGKVGTDSEQVESVQSASGRRRRKRKKSHGADVMPEDEMKTEDDSTLASHFLPAVIQEDKKLGNLATDSEQVALVESASGQKRRKRKKSRGADMILENEMKTEDDSTLATQLVPVMILDDKKLGNLATDSEQVALVQSASGRKRGKKKKSRGADIDDSSPTTHLLPDMILGDKKLGNLATDSEQAASVQSASGQKRGKKKKSRGADIMAEDEMKTEDDSSLTTHLLPDMILEDKKLDNLAPDSEQVASVQSASGPKKGKRKKPRGGDVMPEDVMKMEDNSTPVTHLVPDMMPEDKKLDKLATDSEQVAPVQSASGRKRDKRKKPHDEPAPPPHHTHLLNPVPMPFKKKGKKK